MLFVIIIIKFMNATINLPVHVLPSRVYPESHTVHTAGSTSHMAQPVMVGQAEGTTKGNIFMLIQTKQ